MHDILTPYQRFIFGSVENGVYSCTALLEAVLLYEYNNKFDVSLEYLGLASFVIGTMAAYVAVLAGNMSDRSFSPHRRKFYVLVFGPLNALGLFLRYGAFTSNENAAQYYILSFALQVTGYTGLAVVMQAWGVELVSDVGERSKLYSVTTGCSFGGVVVGLLLANISLKISAVVIPVVLLACVVLCCLHLPDKTPLDKRAFVPTVTNISSVFWNSQFLIYLIATSLVASVNTIPPLVIFFLKYCMGIASENLSMGYSLCIGTFAAMGVASLPFVKTVVDRYGTLLSLKVCLLVAAFMGFVVLGCSYGSIYMIVACFGIIGLFSTFANVVLAIIYAQSIDYDELLCGKKRASSYSGVHTPIRIFIQIAGSSIPLILMSAVGFQASDDDSDDADSSSSLSTLVLRLWCSVFISLCMIGAVITVSYFKIDVPIYKQIQETIARRDLQNSGLDGAFGAESGSMSIPNTSESPSFSRSLSSSSLGVLEVSVGAIKSNLERVSREIPASVSNLFLGADSVEGQVQLAGLYSRSRPVSLSRATGGSGSDVAQPTDIYVMLNSVTDPVTLRPVEPPPFALVTQIIDITYPSAVLGTASQACDETDTKRDETALRNFALFFPERLGFCATPQGRIVLVSMYVFEVALFVVVSGYGAYQAIAALVHQNQDVAYLAVFVTVVCTLYLAYLGSLMKGVMLLRSLQIAHRPQLEEKLQNLAILVERSKEAIPGGVTNIMHPSENGEGTKGDDVAMETLETFSQSVVIMRWAIAKRLLFCVLCVVSILLTVHAT